MNYADNANVKNETDYKTGVIGVKNIVVISGAISGLVQIVKAQGNITRIGTRGQNSIYPPSPRAFSSAAHLCEFPNSLAWEIAARLR